jgi:hypothetical protein
MSVDVIGGWVGLILTACCWSMVIKENIFWRFAEYTLLGTSVGIVLTTSITRLAGFGTDIASGGHVSLIIPLILGLLFFARFSRQYIAFARYPLAVQMGITMALTGSASILNYVINQLAGAVGAPGGFTIEILFQLVITVSVLLYFMFTLQRKGAYSVVWNVGKLGFLGLFGVHWALYTLYRVNLAVGRLMAVLGTLGLV